MSEKCHVCGDCWWVSCDNPADYTKDVDLKRHGLPVYSGGVDLCAGHNELVDRTGRMNLKWEAVEQALAMKKVRA